MSHLSLTNSAFRIEHLTAESSSYLQSANFISDISTAVLIVPEGRTGIYRMELRSTTCFICTQAVQKLVIFEKACESRYRK